jgi:hypothetical protein
VKDEPIELFLLTTSKDAGLFKTHLKQLERQQVRIFYPHTQLPGADKRSGARAALASSQIVVLGVSSDLIAADTDDAADSEDAMIHEWLVQAMTAHEQGRARVVPVILRSCDWRRQRYGELEVLPPKGKPVERWRDRHEAWTEVLGGLKKVIGETLIRY